MQLMRLGVLENLLKLEFAWGCTDTYCGEWEHFEFTKSFAFQTAHIREFLIEKGEVQTGKDLRLKDVKSYNEINNHKFVTDLMVSSEDSEIV